MPERIAPPLILENNNTTQKGCSMSLYQRTPSQVMADVIEVMLTGLVSFVTSSPGLGKSSIFYQIAAAYRLLPIDLRLSQCAPEDLMGLPMRTTAGKATFAPFTIFPIQGDPLPEGYDGWLLILDEFNSAPKSVQAAAYKIILDKMVGQEKLHENVAIVAAGNLATDKAIVNSLGTAMQSRLIHIEMIADLEEFKAYAYANNFDKRIISFLDFQPSKLHVFKPDHHDKTFPCPRTWEFVSKLIKDKNFNKINLALLAGTISEGVATEFYTFLQEFENLPAFKDILGNPEQTPVPPEASTKFALTTSLLDLTNKDSFEQIAKYIQKFPPENQVLFFKNFVKQTPSIRTSTVFLECTKHLTRFLEEDDYKLPGNMAA